MSRSHPQYSDSSPPPGQGYYPSVPPSRHDRGHDRQEQYFSPPPTSAYDDRDYVPPRESQEAYYGDRPYAPSDTQPTMQLAAYDDEIAEAGWRRRYEDTRPYTHLPPPPSDYDLGGRPRRADDDRYYDDRSEYYDDDRDRERSRRRRYSSTEERVTEPADAKKGGRDIFGASEGERGLGAKLVGGAGGAFLGRKFGKGTLGTMAGAVVGSIAATAIEKQIEQRKEGKSRGRRSRGDDIYEPSPRDMQDMRDENRTRARSGFRERLRSLSRKGARTVRSVSAGPRRRRRSDSLSSEESYRRSRY